MRSKQIGRVIDPAAGANRKRPSNKSKILPSGQRPHKHNIIGPLIDYLMSRRHHRCLKLANVNRAFCVCEDTASCVIISWDTPTQRTKFIYLTLFFPCKNERSASSQLSWDNILHFKVQNITTLSLKWRVGDNAGELYDRLGRRLLSDHERQKLCVHGSLPS